MQSSSTTHPLLDRILTRLGFGHRPEPTLPGLEAIYDAWCRRVPFDNVRKLIHVRNQDARPLPGDTPEDFFEAWLRHGTGGTCWSGAGACHALLMWLGFDAERGIATMIAAPNLPPNHGTVRVRIRSNELRNNNEGSSQLYLVDTAMLYGKPLRLEEVQNHVATRVKYPPAWAVRYIWRQAEDTPGPSTTGADAATANDQRHRLHITWRPMHKPDGFECRLERFGATADEYHQRYESTRAWSPFNYALTARLNRGDEVVGLAFGQSVTLHADGRVTQTPIVESNADERRRRLIEDLGMSEEIVSQLPPDVPTPPPPGSQTALREREARSN